jgi:hypothetical protein
MATILTANGITFDDSTSLNSKYGIFPQSTVTLFYEASAPTGWTKVITHDNKALRVVSGTGGGSGGSISFTSAFVSAPISQTVTVSGVANAINLTMAQIPSHTHPDSITAGGAHAHPYVTVVGASPNGAIRDGGARTINSSPPTSQVNTGDGGNHAHPLTVGATGGSPAPHGHPWSGTAPLSTSLDFRVQYIDTIFCSFN